MPSSLSIGITDCAYEGTFGHARGCGDFIEGSFALSWKMKRLYIHICIYIPDKLHWITKEGKFSYSTINENGTQNNLSSI